MLATRRLSPLRSLRVFSASTARWASKSALVAPHLFDKLLEHADARAIVAKNATWTYADVVHEAVKLRDEILPAIKSKDDRQPRVAFLGARGPSYLAIQWGVWLAGGIAVPLHPAHPNDELDYILTDSGASLLIASESYVADSESKLAEYVAGITERLEVPIKTHEITANPGKSALEPQMEADLRQWVETNDHDKSGAYMIYTSGTTGRPKGVVTTHAGLTAQIHDIVSAWEMTANDHLLHFLPLHHVHGILNNMLCVMYAGGSVEFLPSANTEVIWSKLASSTGTRPTMFMAVPTVYMKLLEALDDMEARAKESGDAEQLAQVTKALDGARGLRVAISGSMACPVSIMSRWEERTGLRLLERYGMTELGMVLTNPLHGERHMGYVGNTFPSVSVRIVDTETEEEIPRETEQEGELRVKGPTVFREYWNKPEATAKEFDAEGWFKTGDVVQFSNERDSFRIRGRASADILKSAGYKISALDVERALLAHPEVAECAVFGLPDEKWGQIVSAVVRVSGDPESYSSDSFSPPLTEFMREHLADYRAPRKYFFVQEIPKNAMGKVNKKSLAKIFAEGSP